MPRYLVVGSGGREHAIAWKLAAERNAEVIVVPGNPGIARTAGCTIADVDVDDHDTLADFAWANDVDLTVVGPEAPLCAGLADHFRARGLAIFGPDAAAAQLEGSKSFAKRVMNAAGVPTAEYAFFDDYASAVKFVRSAEHPIVIKADGLAGGKGVVISTDVEQSVATLDEFVRREKFGESSTSVVVEEFLGGPEMSFMVVTDGTNVVPLSTSRDHKRIGDGDTGPNTGGMGAITPSPDATDALRDEIVRTIVEPTLDELQSRGMSYRGFLYIGLMLTAAGPRVLEFNVRLGDPETQALMMAMEDELGPTLIAAAHGELKRGSLETKRAACCVVLASKGYPLDPRKGDSIEGLDRDTPAHTYLFHAGTKREADRWITGGGRVLGVTSCGEDVDTARRRAYAAAEQIRWPGMQFRRDIGA